MPGLNLCAFLTPPVEATGWDVFLAALLANCFLGALEPVFFLAVYFVRAIWELKILKLLIIIVRAGSWL